MIILLYLLSFVMFEKKNILETVVDLYEPWALYICQKYFAKNFIVTVKSFIYC